MGGCFVPQQLTKRQEQQEKLIRELLEFREQALKQRLEQDRAIEQTSLDNHQLSKLNDERITRLEEEVRKLRQPKREKSPITVEPSIESRIEKILSNDSDIRKTYEKVKSRLGRS